MKNYNITFLALVLTLLGSSLMGCATRTVYVRDSDPMYQDNQGQASAPAPIPNNGQNNYDNSYDYDQRDVLNTNEFQRPLAAYGRWTQHQQYGQIWIPASQYAGQNFRPYTRGHWEHTNLGWSFVSNDPFAWATYHYGRWANDMRFGWIWVPGTVWAPSWVSWRHGNNYVGWAPMPPRSGVSLSYNISNGAWNFTSYQYFGSANIHQHIIYDSYQRQRFLRDSRLDRQTTRIRNRQYYRGPEYNRLRNRGVQVRQRSNRQIEQEYRSSRRPKGIRLNSRQRRLNGGDRRSTIISQPGSRDRRPRVEPRNGRSSQRRSQVTPNDSRSNSGRQKPIIRQNNTRNNNTRNNNDVRSNSGRQKPIIRQKDNNSNNSKVKKSSGRQKPVIRQQSSNTRTNSTRQKPVIRQQNTRPGTARTSTTVGSQNQPARRNQIIEYREKKNSKTKESA